MRVLIIGSKGFIGSHLVRFYKNQGFDVWGVDVIVDYVNRQNYFLIDASNSDFNLIFQNPKYDLCVNCSGAASVPDSITNPIRDYYLNTVNVFKILEAIRLYQPECKFVNLSSAAVYGNPKSLPVSDDAVPNPVSPYGIHKLHSEQICFEFCNFWNIQTISVRLFSVYGVGLKKQLFWDLYQKAESGKMINLYGTGNESRDFIHISDLVRAIDLVSRKADFNGQAINVANGVELSIKHVVTLFYKLLNPAIQFKFSGQERKGDPINWRADISELVSFGYIQETEIGSGLKQYIKWIRQIEAYL